MDWLHTGKICGLLSAITAGVFLGSLPPDDNLVATPSDTGFDNRVLDFADVEARQTLIEHERFLRNWNLESLRCHPGRESYRVFNEPGLMGGNMVIVEAQVEGSTASLDVREFGRLAIAEDGRSHGWNPVASRQLSPTRFSKLHDQLTDILRTQAAPQINDRFVDASRVTVETCRRQRYHFFVRNSDEDTDAVIVLLARSILHLAGRDRENPWSP